MLNDLVGYAVTTGRIHLMSDGTPWRPIVHIEDISRAFLAVLEAPRELIHDQAFNVGRTAENYRIRELAEIVAETVPGCAITYAEDAGPDKRCYRVDCEKILRVLPAFQPRWDARKGARELPRRLPRGRSHRRAVPRRPLHPPEADPGTPGGGTAGRGAAVAGDRPRLDQDRVGASTRTTHVPLALLIAVSSSNRQLSRRRFTITSDRRERKVKTMKMPPSSRNAS